MKTFIPKTNEIQNKWVLIDAKSAVLGRLATKIATILMGKDKTNFTPHMECGDHVVVINANDIRVTGRKADQKIYNHYSGYPGGLKEYDYKTLKKKKPEEIIKRAVKGMLPKNLLGRKMLKRLHIYIGAEHKHTAQNPTKIEI